VVVEFKRLILILVGLFLIVASILFLFVQKDALLSFVVAYVSSSLVVLASFKTYKNMVDKRLALNDGAFEIDDRDTIDKLEDPYNLYDSEQEHKELDIKEAIKLEKKLAKANRRSLKETAKDSSAAFSFNRLLAYAALVGGFFYLLNSNNLNLLYYLPTLALPNIISVIYLINSKK
jgi:Flp pilus assembly protein TadB